MLAKTLHLIIAIILFFLAGRPSVATAQTLTTLWSFTGAATGAQPLGGLVQGSDGNFYGTTYLGGASTNCDIYGCGTVFRISPAGSLTNLHSFSGLDGSNPTAGLTEGNDGAFYGMTEQGGTNNYGTVFRITPGGSCSTLYTFASSTFPNDGQVPVGGLVLGVDGNFYGTAYDGGSNNCGTVFKINSAGTLTLLHSFTNGADGCGPQAGLLQGSDSNFYGTTEYGGANTNCTGGCGTVFKISPEGTLTVLSGFTGDADGGNPGSTLVQGRDGNFYGTSMGFRTNANCDGNCGAVFKVSPAGTLTVLYDFAGGPDGSGPSGIVEGDDGNFYGTTEYGGTNSRCGFGCGSVFKISPAGKFVTLYSFDVSDGYSPGAGLVRAGDGNFYGTTQEGGVSTNCPGGCGTVFKLSVGLACTYRLSHKIAKFEAAGGPSTVKVSTRFRDCDWTADSNDSFLTITAGTNGVGEGSVSYTVASNADTVARLGTMTIASEIFTVDQAAASCEFSLDDTSAIFGAAGGSSNVTVTANGTNCAWKVDVTGPFIKITSGGRGVGDGMVDYTVDANAKTSSRKGVITIGKEKLTILQSGAP